MVAEGNDALMEEFFDKGTLAPAQIAEGLKQGLREMRIFPVMCASAAATISPPTSSSISSSITCPPRSSARLSPPTVNGAEATRKIAENDQPSLFVFKTTADPFAGRITFSRS